MRLQAAPVRSERRAGGRIAGRRQPADAGCDGGTGADRRRTSGSRRSSGLLAEPAQRRAERAKAGLQVASSLLVRDVGARFSGRRRVAVLSARRARRHQARRRRCSDARRRVGARPGRRRIPRSTSWPEAEARRPTGSLRRRSRYASCRSSARPTVASSSAPRSLRSPGRVGEIRPDLVHGHSSNGGLHARLAARRLGLPSVYTAHGWPFQKGASVAAAAHVVRRRVRRRPRRATP